MTRDIKTKPQVAVMNAVHDLPVLVARDKDLPKAQQDLGPFIGDAALQKEIQTALEHLLGHFEGIAASYLDHPRAMPVLQTATA